MDMCFILIQTLCGIGCLTISALAFFENKKQK